MSLVSIATSLYKLVFFSWWMLLLLSGHSLFCNILRHCLLFLAWLIDLFSWFTAHLRLNRFLYLSWLFGCCDEARAILFSKFQVIDKKSIVKVKIRHILLGYGLHGRSGGFLINIWNWAGQLTRFRLIPSASLIRNFLPGLSLGYFCLGQVAGRRITQVGEGMRVYRVFLKIEKVIRLGSGCIQSDWEFDLN